MKKPHSPKSQKRSERLKKAPVVSPRPTPVDDEFTDSFINEVTEDVKNDELKVFWNRYGLFVILFVVLAVSAAVGFETLKNWRESKYGVATEKYMAIVDAPNLEEAKNSLEQIAQNDSGIYSELARVQIANILFEQNKGEEAAKVLQEIIDDTSLNKRIRTLATLKLAAYKLDKAPRTEIEALLHPVVAAKDSWQPLALDLLAMSAIENGDIADARQIYTELLETSNLSENFKTRIQDMLSALNDM